MFLDAITRRELPKAIGNASAYGRWLLEHGGHMAKSGVQVTEQTAMTLTYVYACINVLAQTLAHTPLELLKRTNKGTEKANRHRLFELVRTTPHQYYSAYTWRETLEGHRNGWGNAFALIERDGPYVDQLKIVYPDRTEIRRLNDGSVVYRFRDDDNKVRNVLAADMLHFAGLGFDGLQGYSPIAMARESVGLGLAVHQFGASFFGNGASPKGVIESEVPANTLASFAEEFRKNYGSIENAHGTPVLPKGLTYKPVSIDPNDAQALETLKFNRTEICGMFRVPPQFVMDLERSTFTNAGEMDLHFVKHTIIPIFANYEAEMNRKLLTEKERRIGYHFKFDVKGLLRGATKDRYDSYHIALQDGWLSRNEVRKLEDMSQEDGLSEFLTPNNMVNSEAMPSAGKGDDMPVIEEDKFYPLVLSIAQRMASNERRTLQRLGEDTAAVAKFYKNDYPEFVKRAAQPLAEVLTENGQSENFVANFTHRHIDNQLSQMVQSVGQVTISERTISETFYEVLHEQS